VIGEIVWVRDARPGYWDALRKDMTVKEDDGRMEGPTQLARKSILDPEVARLITLGELG